MMFTLTLVSHSQKQIQCSLFSMPICVFEFLCVCVCSEIATGTSITWMESCVPTRSGNTMIYAVLDCSVLGNVQGNWAIDVQA